MSYLAKDTSIKSMKQLTKKISDSSQKFLASFLDDNPKLRKEQAQLLKQIDIACSQQSFVVLQLANKREATESAFETTYGKLKRSPNNTDMVILTDEQTDKVRMIPVRHIKKISFLKSKQTDTSQQQLEKS